MYRIPPEGKVLGCRWLLFSENRYGQFSWNRNDEVAILGVQYKLYETYVMNQKRYEGV